MSNIATDGTILIVDDLPENLQVLSELLTVNGYRVRVAKSGIEAIDSIKALLPDLVILDIKLPDISGFEVCAKLKADAKTKSVPVIFLSALSGTTDILRGFEVGGIDYIVKPFKTIEVLARVQTQIDMSRLRNKLKQQTLDLQNVNDKLLAEIEKSQRSENELKIRNNLLTALINSPKDIIIFSLDCQYCYTTFNEKHRAEMKAVWNVDIQVGASLLACMHNPHIVALAKKSIDAALSGEVLSEIQLQSEAGIYYEFSWNPIFQSNEVLGVTCFIRDITERIANEMLLKEKNEEIEVQNEEYQQLNEEQLQVNEELQEAKERAEESDRLKTAFLQNVSHEIRTPMNAIMGFSELLIDQYNNKVKLEQYSRIINQRCADLLDIVTEILDIAKIESGQLNVNIDECKLTSLFSEISLLFNEQIKRTDKTNIQFELQIQCGANESVILTDKVKLKQIFINLIGNAFKFTNIGSIEAGCKVDSSGHLQFYVSDTGIGIPIEKQKFVFERFTQLEQTPNHLYGGAGLGLSIVQGLVNLMGGKIWLESEIGKGTTFFFSFPYISLKTISHDNVLIEKPQAYNFSNKTILIVDDDTFTAEYITEVLITTGISILLATSGEDAVIISKTEHLDIILMDIRLPDIDGYQATRRIRKHKPNLKIIAQTSYVAQNDKEKALNAGCNAYISKPIRRNALLTLINEQLTAE